LRGFLLDGDPEVRYEAVYKVWLHFRKKRTRDTNLRDDLIKLLDDSDLRVRLWACGCLGNMGDRVAIPPLVKALDDPELFVRYRAAEGLGMLGQEFILNDDKVSLNDLKVNAVEPLENKMRKESWYMGAYCLEALRRILPELY